MESNKKNPEMGCMELGKKNNPEMGCTESNEKKSEDWMYGIGKKKFRN